MNEPKRAVRVGFVKPVTLSRVQHGILRLSMVIPHPQDPRRVKYVRMADWPLTAESVDELESKIRATVQDYADRTRDQMDISRLEWVWLSHPEHLHVRFEA